MLNYFTTKQKMRKTYWQMPMWIDEKRTGYKYDKFGRQIRASSDKGDDIRYEYDIFGRLSIVTDATTGQVTTYEYDLVGNLSRTIEANGTKTTHYFTFDGHSSTRALLDFTGAIIQLYNFDAYGNALGFDPSQSLTEFLYSGTPVYSGDSGIPTKVFFEAVGRNYDDQLVPLF
jgi:YD repeat-containing protein